MARSIRSKELQSRSARLKLEARHGPYYVRVGKGLSLGYRRAQDGFGSWYVRRVVDGKYKVAVLGMADDYDDSNGKSILTYDEAQDMARDRARGADKSGQPKAIKRYTVSMAAAEYLDWIRMNKKSYDTTKTTIDAHILPKLGRKKIEELTTPQIRTWLDGLLNEETEEKKKKRKPATVNRIASVLKALLTKAWVDGYVDSNVAWARIKPLPEDGVRHRHLTVAESNKLTNACDPEFRPLVRAALLTGMRYGEVAALRVGDYNPDAGTVHIVNSKSGNPRHVPLNEEGEMFFDEMALDRPQDEYVFLRADGGPWGKSHAFRFMKDACAAAKIEPRISFHVLRHTYASLLAMEGVTLQVIAAALGHSSTAVTEKHYAHLLPNYVAETIRANLPRFDKTSSKVTVLHRRNRKLARAKFAPGS